MCQEYSKVPCSVCLNASCIGILILMLVQSPVVWQLYCYLYVKVSRLVLLYVKSKVVCHVVFVSVHHV